MHIEYDPVFVASPRSVIGFSFDPSQANEELEALLKEEGYKLKTLPDAWAYTNTSPPENLMPNKKNKQWNGHQRNYWKYLGRQKRMKEPTKMILPYIKEGEVFILPIEKQDEFIFSEYPTPSLDEVDLDGKKWAQGYGPNK